MTLRKTPNGIGWILPLCRVQRGLGLSVLYDADGSASLMYPTGDKVELKMEQGLAFIPWEDFLPIRKMLGDSHI